MKLGNPFRSTLGNAALGHRTIDRQLAHLSTPPRIGSSIPRLAIMSAM
jgi:hypothetical protein